MAMVLLGTPVTTYIAEAEPVASGTCGDESVNNGNDVEWQLETNGDKVTVEGVEKDAYTLTISGSGAMTATLYESWPWKGYRSAITEVVVAEGVTSLSGYAFEQCSALSTASLPASLTTIYGSAFNSCGALTSITLAAGSTVFEVSNNGALLAGKDGTLVAYARMNSNEHLVVPDGVTDIPAGFFSVAQHVTSVSLPASLTTIGDSAFYRCEELSSIALAVGNTAFEVSNNGALLAGKDGTLVVYATKNSNEHLVVPDGVKDIPAQFFANAQNVTSVSVPSSVLSLGARCFKDTSLTSFTVPESVTSIGEGILEGCYSLASITVADASSTFATVSDALLYDTSSKTLLAFAPSSSASSLSVPAGVSAIPDSFFAKARYLECILLPASLTKVGSLSFWDSHELTSVVLPPSVSEVGYSAFSSTPSLTYLFAPASASFGSYATHQSTNLLMYHVEGTQDGKTAVKITSASKAATVCNNAMGPDYVITGTTAGNVTFQSGHTWDAANYECADCASSGSCEHVWAAATCTEPKTCSVCRATEGEANGHTWVDATCTTPKTCSVCRETEGAAKGHTWVDADCTTPKTCSICDAPEGEPLNHDMAAATCTEPKKCKREGCTHTEGDPLDHDLSDAVISEPTAEKLGVVHRKCSRGDYDVFSHYTLGDGASPTMYPDGTRISDASYTPKAGGPFNFNGQEIEILLQDPLGVLGSGELGLTVRQTDLPATFDGDVPVEHQHSYDIIPTVNGLEKSGKLSNKVRLLYKIPQGWDRHDLEVFLAQAGEDREFDEVTEKIGNDEYLVVWTDHFSPYVFVDKLNPEEKAALETLQDADGSNGDSNSPQGDSGNGQSNGNNSAKTGDASGELLMLSTLAMIATGLYLGLFLKKKKSF